MRLLFFAACAALLWQTCVRAQGVKPDTEYGQRNTFSVFADYSNDSSHMIIGQEENRKIGAIGIGYSLRLAHKKYFDFSYEPELRPFTVLRDPVVSGTSTVEVQGNPTAIDNVPESGPFSGPTLNDDCVSGTSTFQGITANGVIYTQTVTQQCGTRWSYLVG